LTRQQRMVLAGVMAVLSAILTVFVLRGGAGKTESVVVATRDIQPFTLVLDSDLKVMQVDAGTAQTLFPSAYKETAALAGRVALRRIAANEVISRTVPTLAPRADMEQSVKDLPISTMVPEGFRAVSLSSVSVGATPGDYIYLFQSKTGAVTSVLSKPVQVIGERSSGLVVLVADADVVTLLAAASGGSLQAALAPAVGMVPGSGS
jgi:hypothetical protein